MLDLLEKEKNDLSKTVSNMLTEINTQRGILEYSMHEKEQHIESLMAEIECLKKDNAELLKRLDGFIAADIQRGQENWIPNPEKFEPKISYGFNSKTKNINYTGKLPKLTIPIVEKKKKQDAENAKRMTKKRKIND